MPSALAVGREYAPLEPLNLSGVFALSSSADRPLTSPSYTWNSAPVRAAAFLSTFCQVTAPALVVSSLLLFRSTTPAAARTPVALFTDGAAPVIAVPARIGALPFHTSL